RVPVLVPDLGVQDAPAAPPRVSPDLGHRPLGRGPDELRAPVAVGQRGVGVEAEEDGPPGVAQVELGLGLAHDPCARDHADLGVGAPTHEGALLARPGGRGGREERCERQPADDRSRRRAQPDARAGWYG
ncbi:MAG: hypothetical protein ACK559_29640, partial [bacterium]